MPRPVKSYTIITEPGKKDIECDAYTCRHCNKMVRVPKKPLPGTVVDLGYCPMCDANICGNCSDIMAKTLKCIPFERVITAYERKQAFLAQVVPEDRNRADVQKDATMLVKYGS